MSDSSVRTTDIYKAHMPLAVGSPGTAGASLVAVASQSSDAVIQAAATVGGSDGL